MWLWAEIRRTAGRCRYPSCEDNGSVECVTLPFPMNRIVQKTIQSTQGYQEPMAGPRITCFDRSRPS